MKQHLLPLILIVTFGLLRLRVACARAIIRKRLEAYRRGDHQAAMKLVEGWTGQLLPTTARLYFRGEGYFELGHLEEAEQAISRSLALETRPMMKLICRDQLGRVRMARERWDQAARDFLDCVKQGPQRGGCHRAVAELLLRRGGDPPAALDAARRALASDRAAAAARGPLGREVQYLNLCESLAVFAWAHACNHSTEALVDGALSEAFTANGGKLPKPILAELHYFAGQAHAALGNQAESQHHFQQAVAVEPLGNYGRLCASLLSPSLAAVPCGQAAPVS